MYLGNVCASLMIQLYDSRLKEGGTKMVNNKISFGLLF